MNKRDWQEKTNIDNIDQCLEQTSVYLLCIPGQEWKLWKVGKSYCLQRVLPTQSEKYTSTDLTELLLWFVAGDVIKKAQYEPLPTGNVVSFAEKRGER
jgi:hypothetical protein